MSDATFAAPDLTTFTGLDELGLEVVGQRLEPVIASVSHGVPAALSEVTTLGRTLRKRAADVLRALS